MNRSVTILFSEILILLVDILLDCRFLRSILKDDCSVFKLLQNSVDLFYCDLAVCVYRELNLCFNALVSGRCNFLFHSICTRIEFKCVCGSLGFPSLVNFVSGIILTCYGNCSAFEFFSAEVSLADLDFLLRCILQNYSVSVFVYGNLSASVYFSSYDSDVTVIINRELNFSSYLSVV